MKVLVWVYTLAWLSWHIFTLDKNPLPWYDETYFASVSKSILSNGEMVPTVVYSVNEHQPVYHYGPFYFWLGALSFKWFGFGAFQFRIVNFIFGLGLLWISYKIFEVFTSNRTVSLFGIVLLSIDPFFNLCLHEGRMDIMVCFLVLTAFYLVLRSTGKVLFYESAILLGIGLLTTSRAIFYFPAFAIFLRLTGKSYSVIFSWLVISGLPLLVWLTICFGSVDHLLSYINHKNSEESLGYFFNTHWPLYMPVHVMPVFAFSIVSLLTTVFVDPEKLLKAPIVFCIGVIAGYYTIVVDYGPYSIFILPLLYGLVLVLFKYLGKWAFTGAGTVLFIFNFGYFSLKAHQVWTSLQFRDPTLLEIKINSLIPDNSNVVGDALLYYVVEKSNCKFQYIDHFGNDISVREKILIKDFDFEYLILSDQYMMRSAEDANFLIESGRYEFVGKVDYGIEYRGKNTLPLQLLSQLENLTGYNCTIYRRYK